MLMKRRYRCPRCGQTYSITEQRFRCDCGSYLTLESQARFRPDQIQSGQYSMWRYRTALPIEDSAAVVSLGEGMTPLIPIPRLRGNLLGKLEYVSPTGSFKDRGASVLVSFLKEIGISRCVEDSSGNAGSALSAYAAHAGIRCEIYTPAHASSGKIAQMEFTGAQVHRIPGSRAETAQAILKAVRHTFYASHNWNPFFLEGLKTIAFEIAEQLRWQAPEVVILPLGFGGLFIGVYHGFRELQQAGVISRLPRMMGVQALHCAPLYQAFRKGLLQPEKSAQIAPTLAEGIAAETPIRGEMVLTIVRETGGAITAVSEEEIVRGTQELHRKGILVEPTSAVVLPGLRHLQADGLIETEENVVAIFTGSALKAVPELQKIHRRIRSV